MRHMAGGPETPLLLPFDPDRVARSLVTIALPGYAIDHDCAGKFFKATLAEFSSRSGFDLGRRVDSSPIPHRNISAFIPLKNAKRM